MRSRTLSITPARGDDEQRERLGRIGRLLNDLAEEVEAVRSEVAELAIVPAPSAPPIHQRLLTVVEVAGAIGVGQSTVHSLIRSGRLKSRKIGGSRRIHVDDLDEFVARLPSDAIGA